MTTSLTRKTTVFAALGLAIAVMLVGGFSFQRKLETFRRPGMVFEESGPRLTIESVDSSLHEALRAGDQIQLVNTETISSTRALLRLLAESPTSDLLVKRGEEMVSVAFVRPPLEIDYSYLVQALIGAFYLLIGLYTIVRQQGRQSVLFYLWCLVSSAFYILVSTPFTELTLDGLGRSLYVLEEAARLLLPPLTLHFFITFPKHLSRAVWIRRLTPFFYLPAALLATLQWDLIFNNGRLLLEGPNASGIATALRITDRVGLLHLTVFAVASVALLLYESARDIDKEVKRQLLWISLGTGCGYAPFLLLYGVPWSFGLQGPTALEVGAVLPLAIVPLTFAYAILRYRLWDITIIARDVATYTLTLLFGFLGFSLLRLAVERGVPEGAELTRNFLTVAAAFLVGGLLLPARQRIGGTLERAYYRSGFSKRRTLASLGKELLHERDLDRLCRVLLDQLDEGLSLEKTNLFVTEGEQLRPVHYEEEPIRSLSAAGFSDDFWNSEVEPLSGIGLPEATLSPVQSLFSRGYRYAFPLTVRDRRVGLLTTSYGIGETPLSSEDQDLIRQVLNQAALAIENAHLLERLQHQLDEVQELKLYNEGIIEASPAGIAVLDADDRIVSANLAFSALAGAESGATKRRRLQDVLPLERLPSVDEGLVELTVSDAQGRQRHLQLSVAEFSTRTSRDSKVLILADISERVAMEKDLEEKGRLAAIGVMAAGIAHEVNTPLTGISSYAQMLLAKTDPGDPRYELLKKVERQTFRASGIVNSLLSLARSRTQKPENLELGPLLNECADLVVDTQQAKAVRIERNVEPDLIVTAREGELQQVFTNLISNSIEAMGPKGGHLLLSASVQGKWTEVVVEDTGPGIDGSLRKKVFEPFYSTKQDQGGTGLGLSISAEIIHRNGGQLNIEDPSDGFGCRIAVRLTSAEN